MGKFVAQDFSQGPVLKHLINISIPMILAMLVQVCYNLIDRIYLGHLDNAAAGALTGLGLSFPFISIVMAFTNLFATGGAPLFAINRGKQDLDTAFKILNTTYTLILIFSVFIVILSYLFLKPLLYTFGASDLSYPFARDYLAIYILGTPCVMLSSGLNGFINAQGFSKIAMLSVMSGALINLILDPLFIFTFDLGIKGAAFASVLAQMFSAWWVLRFLVGKKSLIKLQLTRFLFDLKLSRQIVALGISGFTMQGTNALVQIICNITLKAYGGDIYIGIMTILVSVREVLFLPMRGVQDASKPIVAFNFGAGKVSRIMQCLKLTTISTFSYLFICWLIIFFNPEFVFKIFSDDLSTLNLGVEAMHIYFFGFFMMALHGTGQSFFVALGKAKQATFFALFRKAIIVVPLTILLPMIGNLGVNGVFMAEPISNIASGLCCYVTMLFTLKLLFKEHS